MNWNAQEVPITWDVHGLPHSVAFDDKYFCKQNGYEETLHVSCQGNNLRERFLKLDPQHAGTFTIIEAGFGTGLSFCVAWQLWEECAPVSWTLHFISIELYPISASQLDRALSLWPVLLKYKKTLVEQYRPKKEGLEHLYFENRRIHLSLVFDHVIGALAQIKQKNLTSRGVDAWFLNGFAPSKNPEMWSEEVFRGMSVLSREGTTMSTFTVAGFVRRGLEAEGFMVEKIKGYGEKKHILTGLFKGNKKRWELL